MWRRLACKRELAGSTHIGQREKEEEEKKNDPNTSSLVRRSRGCAPINRTQIKPDRLLTGLIGALTILGPIYMS